MKRIFFAASLSFIPNIYYAGYLPFGEGIGEGGGGGGTGVGGEGDCDGGGVEGRPCGAQHKRRTILQ